MLETHWAGDRGFCRSRGYRTDRGWSCGSGGMEIEDRVSIERSDLAHMRGGVAFLMPNDVFDLVSRLVGIVDF